MAGEVVGSITLDGNLAEWTASDQIDKALSLSGYDIYAKATGGSYVFALKAPVAIGANTTAWLNTDQSTATGYKIWGFAGGAEYNINFDAAGVPRLYTGDAGQTLVSGATVSFGYSADRTVVEFAVAASAIGSPAAINTLWDINNNTFLPTDFSAAQYTVATAAAPAPGPALAAGSITLDGNLADWTAADQIDKSLSVSGYDLYAKATGGSYVFAVKAPVAIGANTTLWLNTDQNTATGYKIWGFAGGAEYNINFDASGNPQLYTGADGQTLVSGVPVTFGYSADRTVVEFAVSASAIGGSRAINTLWDINNNTFLPTDYSSTQFEVVDRSVGSITLDGNLADWSAADQIDKTLSTSGYDIYAKASGDSFVFALKAPVAIGANTTAWLNTDQNAATGFKIFGSTGGAEYNINFDASGTPRLYTGDAGQTLVPNVTVAHAYSADRTVVEFAVAKTAVGSPVAINTLWDVNNSTFLPTNFATTQYEVLNLPARTDFDHKIGIVYSDTTANQYFSKMAYSQLFMAAQNQAAMAGVPFDVLTEGDLTNLAKLANYDALLFPSFSHVQGSQLTAIENTLKLAVQQYHIGLVASGNFMTNDQTGAALPGDSYARMKSLLGLQLVTGGFPADVTVNAGDITHPMMQDYTASELIHSYTGVGWLAFAPVTTPGASVLATQTVGGQKYDAVVATTTGGRNVHFSTEAVMADENLLWQAIDYAVNGSGVTAGLQLSRNSSIVASRTDMDQAMELFDVNPVGSAQGIYDKLLPTLQQWKTAYNFVGSYYIDIGNNPAQDQATDWTISGAYYKQLLAMGNELGSHSVSHPENTNVLTAAQFQSEFLGAKQIIEQQMSQILGRPFAVDGAAVPGMPENLATALSIIQYYNYISGGFSSVGAGYPGAFGYLNPAMAGLDKVYLAPNVKFDFSLVEFQGMTPAQASAEWAAEAASLSKHAEVPVLMWPWHDYAAAVWATDPPAPSPYTTQMFTDFISRMYNAGAEFVTLSDLAERISRFDDSAVNWSIAGSTVTATVTSPDAGKFAFDLDNLGTQKIANVTGWYAYDNDSVFLPRNGGTYTINLGAAADDVTHITKLPMRAELLSLSGNGTNLSFSVFGEGDVVLDLRIPAGQGVVVTGGTITSQVGEILTVGLGALGQHDVSITIAAAPGAITLDGNLADWSAADQIDTSLSVFGYDLYGKAIDGSYVFAVKAPVAIGANTTLWLNTDQNAATGYQIWGFAGGAEYNINFDSTGTPRLYTGADGQTLVPGATVSFGYSADRTVVEFAVASSAIGPPAAVNTLWDINNNTFLPTNYSATQYTVAPAVVPGPTPTAGSITLDGSLADWSAANLIDTSLSVAGYDIYAKATGGSYVFALQAPVAIGATTTVWLNTDQTAATGYQIWGFAGGAEYNINFDATGTPRLYTGADGQTLVPGATVSFGYSADKTVVEFAVASNAIGSPNAINALWDINNNTFLPTDYSAMQYTVATAAGSLTLNGTAGNDVLDGGSGNDILIGGPGADLLTGWGGADRFVYNSIGDGLDTITDFGNGNDVLDIKDVLVGFNPVTSNVNNFVLLTGTQDTTLWVNADGAGADFVALTTLQNVQMTGSLLNDMLTQGSLVVS